MFILDPDPTFKFDVALFRPGVKEPQKVRLIGKHQGKSELFAWIERRRASATDEEVLLDIIVGWEDIGDRDRKPVEFSPAAFRALLDNFPGASWVIAETYAGELRANREKN